MKVIPISDKPNQTVHVQLGEQSCNISIYQRTNGLYCDVYIVDKPVLTGVACLNLNRIIRSPHYGFVGDLVFSDTQGSNDPAYPGLGTRYLLLYVEPSDYL